MPATPRRIRLAKGLNVAVDGPPEQEIHPGAPTSSVALIPGDHPGRRFDPLVEVGEHVKLGQPLLRCREHHELVLTAPGAGRVASIDRGRRRALRAVTIALEGPDEVEFPRRDRASLPRTSREEVRETLLASGLWSALRARPFGSIPDPHAEPRALFVTAIDTNPLSPDPAVVLAERAEDFVDGLEVLGRLLDGELYLCMARGGAVPGAECPRVRVVEVSGPHPAGLPGTHMHLVDPAGRGRTHWHVNYQDVASVGRLFTSGRLDVERVVALGGPRVARPRLVRTRLGADVEELLDGELRPGPCTIVSGSVLSGRLASGWGRHLGRYHLSVSALEREDVPARARPGPMIPVEAFDRALPLRLLAAPLLRSLVLGDVERAVALGCLELEEEDLALCAYVCPARLPYGAYLRAVLDEIARAG